MDLLRTNSIKVVGRLKSQDLKVGNRKDNGAGYISGNAIIISNLDGRDCEFEISFYAAQKTKEGKDSQLFTSYSKMGELVGKKIEVTGDIRESRFFSKNADQMVSSQKLNGRFVRGVAESTPDEASFEFGGFVVETLKEKTNKDGDIYRYDLTLGQSNFSGTGMSRFVFHVRPEDIEIVKGVQSYGIGQTVGINGDLRFIVSVVTSERPNEGGFGEAVTRTFVNKQHNFFIMGGTAPITSVEKGMYPGDVIKSLCNSYKARDVELMSSAKDSGFNTPAEKETIVTNRQTSLI